MLSFVSSVNAAINDNIVAYFKLDETSGTSALDEVAGKNATISANVTLNQAGMLGTSYLFNGSSKVETQVTVANIGLNDFSTSWWMYKTETGAIRNLFMNYQDTNVGWIVYKWSDETIRITKSGVVDLTTGISTTNNTWEFWVITIGSDNKFHLYKNGASVWNSTNTAAIKTWNTNFQIVGAPLYGYVGRIDEVGIWNRELSPAEITSLYRGGSGAEFPFEGNLRFAKNYFLSLIKFRSLMPAKLLG